MVGQLAPSSIIPGDAFLSLVFTYPLAKAIIWLIFSIID